MAVWRFHKKCVGTTVVEVPLGWLVTHQFSTYEGSGGIHSVFVKDLQHDMDPHDFAYNEPEIE